MGQALNKLFSVTKREVNMFNLERRTEKIISKDKPTPAPKHPSTIKELARLEEANVSTEYLHKKDKKLDEFLKNVYVSSPDPPPPREREINPNRPLPLKRPADVSVTYGYSESEEATVPEGKVSLKQSLAFINDHQNDPKKHTSVAIATQYKISLADANDILEHFKMFSVKVQKKEVDPESLSTYERLQHRVRNMTILNAPDIVKEIRKVYGKNKEKDKEEKSVAPKLSNEELLSPHPDDTKEKSDSGTKGVTQETKAEDILEKENTGLKDKVNLKKGSERKISQENG